MVERLSNVDHLVHGALFAGGAEELGEDTVLADLRSQEELTEVLAALGEQYTHAVRELEAEPDAGCMYVVAMAGGSVAVQSVPLTLIVTAPGGEA